MFGDLEEAPHEPEVPAGNFSRTLHAQILINTSFAISLGLLIGAQNAVALHGRFFVGSCMWQGHSRDLKAWRPNARGGDHSTRL